MRIPSNDDRAQNLQRTRLVPGLAANVEIIDELDRLVSTVATKMGVTESALIAKVGKRLSEEPRS